MTQVSVIICTHNPRADYLSRVLEALRAQTLTKDRWELLLIDNASDRTLASDWDLSWHANGRIIRESELGLAVARMRGIAESKSDILLFVDDDNVLERDYLEQALKIGTHRPQIGAWGGSTIPEFEVAPQPGIAKHIGYLGLRLRTRAYCSTSLSCQEALPIGAGLSFRTRIGHAYIEQYRQSQIKIGSRKGQRLTSHEDTEICIVACKMGYEIGTFPELRLTHLIKANRVSEEYFARLVGETDYSGHILNYKWDGTVPASPFTPYNIAAFIKGTLLSGRTERRIRLSRTRARMAARREIFAMQKAGI